MGKRDLITKDFALYVVHYFASMQTWSKEDILAEIDRKIKEADEDVVRCNDCENYVSVSPTCGNCFRTTCIQRPNDFCSRSVKRKEATP